MSGQDLVVETDPDIIIGYNICNFDLPYLLNRAEALKLRDFPYWGRMRNKCAFLSQAQGCLPMSAWPCMHAPHPLATHWHASATASRQNAMSQCTDVSACTVTCQVPMLRFPA